MSSSQALQVFRSCTASLSSRTLARSSVPLPHIKRMALVVAARRNYSSDAKADEGKSVKETVERNQNGQEGTTDASSPTSVDEISAALRSKEQEVVDLTVRTSMFVYKFVPTPWSLLYRAVYDTSKQISSTCNATLLGKKSNSATLPSLASHPTY